MRRVVDSVFRGLFLIILGIVFFLNTYGVLPWGFWVNIVDLWPLLLIVAGVALFFNRRVPFSAVMVVFLLALIGYSYFNGVNNYSSRIPFVEGVSGEMELTAPLENGVKNAEVDLNLGGSSVDLSGIKTDASQDSLVSGTYWWNNQFSNDKPRFSYQRSGDTAEIKFNSERKSGSGNSKLELGLSNQVDYDLDVNAGAVSGTFDFSQLRLRNFDLNSGASDVELIFGDTGVHTVADLSAGASKINLVVPENVGLKIRLSGIASGTNFTGDGLLLNGKEWMSSNYDSAKTKIEMKISVAAGKVNLVRPGIGTTEVTH